MNTSLKATLLARLDSLIAEGEEIRSGIGSVQIPPSMERQWYGTFSEGGRWETSGDWNRAVEWLTKTATILENVLPPKSSHRELIAPLRSTGLDGQAAVLSSLKGIRDDFALGLFDSLETRLEVAYSTDILGMAEDVLAEEVKKDSAHIVAAVLCGASLERTLRGLCERHQPPIAITKKMKDGTEQPLAMNALIDELARGDAFNAARAQQLRAWAHIRNQAAHGQWDEFTRGAVEAMLVGVRDFLANGNS